MRKFSLFATIAAAFAGLGMFNSSEKIQAGVDTGLKKKRRRPTFGGGSVASTPRPTFGGGSVASTPRTTFFHGTGAKEDARLSKRAVNDLRACRLNYPGWCGYGESGSLA